MKDKRIKRCPNPECEASIEKSDYGADDVYCTKCTDKLLFVCTKCGKPIEDIDPSHKICFPCQAKKDDLKDKSKDGAKKVVGGLVGIATVAVSFVYRSKK
ncbi:MAG: IBR domain-containing protein [Ancrocorticia sp.]|uniref:IBR domain-containing protein n=1 Tax=Ancrocorticia sp. TaxID=2593684 RepID=UPI003F8F227E